MEEEEGGTESRVDGQEHEGNNEEEGEYGEAQEEGLQQKEIEGGTGNREEGEEEKENDEHKKQTTEQDTQWTEMEISDSFKSFLDDVERDGQRMGNQNKERTMEKKQRWTTWEKTERREDK
ncbi:hypothetical protein M9458_057668 [Cirrhinus mrigala]|uniref:Uncharacterized protein n=1 Tax=Cirrhinus mrigala TaxID=683832 RepID=A0ABD0ME58_CIRMR